MIVVVMGVSGCGKSTVGRALADAMGWPFFDADDYHPPANIAKMANGIPLEDADRFPWLERLRARMAEEADAGRSAVLACSALKEAYRAILRRSAPDVRFVHLRGTPEEILQLMSRRSGHFMKPGMLASQFAALEEPADALTLPVLLSCEQQVTRIRSHLFPAQTA